MSATAEIGGLVFTARGGELYVWDNGTSEWKPTGTFRWNLNAQRKFQSQFLTLLDGESRPACSQQVVASRGIGDA